MVPTLRNMLCLVATGTVAAAALAQSVPAGTIADIEERTRPFGELCLEGEDCGGDESAAVVVVVPTGRSGADVYATACKTCHEAGLNEAPKSFDLEAWASRLDKGMDELVRVSREGLNLMPPMGACMTCSDDELRAAIEFMTTAPED